MGSDRRAFLLHNVDLLAVNHTGANLGDLIQEYADVCTRELVAWVVTDNSAACKLARELVVRRPGYTHVLEMRCHMHAVNLAMQSVVSHSHFSAIFAKCQKVVTFTRTSHAILAAVLAAAQGFQIHTTTTPSNKTRFTSSARCMRSVNELQVPYKSFMLQQADLFRSASGREVVAISSEQHFGSWCDLVVLALHLIATFNVRTREKNGPTSRLALFLVPRYKGLITSRRRGSDRSLMRCS